MTSRKIFAAIGSYGSLGFYRGANEYDYYYYEKKRHDQYLYSEKFSHGIMATIFYLCPVLLPFTISKEIYRLEVVLRGLELEKCSERYNRIT